MRAVEKLLASKRLLVHLSRDFKPVAMFQSFCLEDIVLADLIYSDLVHNEYANIGMFTVDTGRLPDAILRSMDLIRQRYGDILKVYYPNAAELEQFDASYGLRRNDSRRDNEVRLYKPLKRALNHKNAWITASRILNETSHAESRMSWDSQHQLLRFNPLTRWTADEIWSYAKHHDLLSASYHQDSHLRPGLLAEEFGEWNFPEQNTWESTRNIA